MLADRGERLGRVCRSSRRPCRSIPITGRISTASGGRTSRATSSISPPTISNAPPISFAPTRSSRIITVMCSSSWAGSTTRLRPGRERWPVTRSRSIAPGSTRRFRAPVRNSRSERRLEPEVFPVAPGVLTSGRRLYRSRPCSVARAPGVDAAPCGSRHRCDDASEALREATSACRDIRPSPRKYQANGSVGPGPPRPLLAGLAAPASPSRGAPIGQAVFVFALAPRENTPAAAARPPREQSRRRGARRRGRVPIDATDLLSPPSCAVRSNGRRRRDNWETTGVSCRTQAATCIFIAPLDPRPGASSPRCIGGRGGNRGALNMAACSRVPPPAACQEPWHDAPPRVGGSAAEKSTPPAATA